MPYTSKGKCVYKKNKDGSIGKKVGCTKGNVKDYLGALYSNVKENVDFTFNLKRKIMESLLEEVTYHFYNEEGNDDYYDDEEEQVDINVSQDAYTLAHENGLRISNDKDLTYYALDGGVLVGALFCSQNSEYFAFDIVVHPDFRGKSIATKMVDIAMNEFQEGKEIHGKGYHAEIEVINPFLINLMKRKGFKEVGKSHSGVLMKLK